jgi:archaellum component FlaF (FlaF/FlaG flagellin family)
MKNQNATNAGVLQNLSGKLEATFTSDTVSGEARYPYHSQTIQNSMTNVPGYLDFESRSGTPTIHQSITGDNRGIRITLKSDIVSGTYVFPQDTSIINVTYAELQKSGTSFYFTPHKATKAELELNVTEDGRRYSGVLKFEVLINGETLKITSSFDIVLHFNNSSTGQLDTSTTSTPKANASAETLQNITGEFNATFPISANPGETSFARAPYHSSNLFYDTTFLIEDINFYSHSGTNSLDNYRTSDRREFEIHLKRGITSGTYRYPDLDSPITMLRYNEMRYINDRYTSWSLEILEATLELEVIDGRRYVTKNLSIKAKTTTGAILNINADFDVYLSWD